MYPDHWRIEGPLEASLVAGVMAKRTKRDAMKRIDEHLSGRRTPAAGAINKLDTRRPTVNERTQINVRAEKPEVAAWKAAAEEAGLDVSSWLRMVLNAATGDSGLGDAMRRAQRKANDLKVREAKKATAAASVS